MVNVRRLATLSLAVLTFAAVGCGGGGDGGSGTTPPVGGSGSIGVSLANSSASVQTGTSTNTAVSVSRAGGFSGTVALSVEGAPSGVTATLSTASLATGASSATLDMAAATTATPGTYTLTVRASGTGVTAVSATFILTVTAAPVPDFSLLAAPNALTITEGSQGTTQVTVTRSGGFTGSVFLTPSATPTDVAVNFNPSTVSATTSTMTVTVGLGVAAGVYPLTITGAAQGVANRTTPFTLTVAAAPPLGTLTLSPTALAVVQGQSSTPVTVNIARGNGITGSAALTLEALPNGITGSFSPNPATGTSSVLTLNVGSTVPPGTVTIRIRATIGSSSATAEFLLTVTSFVPPDFGVSVNPSALSVVAGASTTSDLTLTRTGGFAGAVAMVVTGAPQGVTATATPTPTTGNSAVVNISTTSAVAPGVYPLVVSATATGITGARTANISLTVNAPMGGGNIQWQFCSASRTPLWFGTRSGTTGAWTQVTPGANVTYAFAFPAAGQVAYVLQGTDGFDVTVFNLTPGEALQTAARECTDNPARKTINGSVTNLLNSRAVAVVMGGSYALAPPGLSTFTLPSVRDGITDVIAMMGYYDMGSFQGFDRIIVRRNLNPAPGATLPVFDFDGSEYFFSASANGFFDNFGSDPFSITMSYVTGNGTVGTYQFDLPSATSPRGLWGVPTNARGANDLHFMTATTSNATAPRTIFRYSSDISSGTVSFGPLLNLPTVTSLGASPVRLRAEGAWQSQYGNGAGVTFTQRVASPNARTVTITGSRTYFGSNSNYEFEVPDFSGAPGWNTQWMLRPGVQTEHIVNALGLAAGVSVTPANGVIMITGARVGSITP